MSEELERLRRAMRGFYLDSLENAQRSIAYEQSRIRAIEVELSRVESLAEKELCATAAVLKDAHALDGSARGQHRGRETVAEAYLELQSAEREKA